MVVQRQRRRRSVPAGPLPAQSGPRGAVLTDMVVLPASSSSSPSAAQQQQQQQQQQQSQRSKQSPQQSPQQPQQQQPQADSGLLAQADALARMTVELNLRAVSAQAERLEQELKELVVCTGQDKAFRREHEARVTDVWREIVAVKTQMDLVRGRHDDMQVQFERCQRDTSNFQRQVRREVTDLKALIDAVAGQLDALPEAAADSPPPSTALPPASAQAPAQAQAQAQTQTQAPAQAPAQAQAPTPSPRAADDPPPPSAAAPVLRPASRAGQAARRRIHEAISSTRRWHRDHKTTALADADFVARYLRQQSKRDPPMAVFIQRAIMRHLQRAAHGRPRAVAASPPRSLDEFCRDVKWRDVIDTVELALVQHADAAAEALRSQPGPR